MHTTVMITSQIIIGRRRYQSCFDFYAKCLEIYGHGQDLPSGRVLHANLITAGLAQSTNVSAKLIAFYIRCGRVSDARKVFDRVPQPSLSCWVVLVGAYSRRGNYRETMELFREMQIDYPIPDMYILPSILRACANMSDQQTGAKIHGAILRHRFNYDVFVISSLIDMYSKCGQVEKARRVFNAAPEKDIVTWNSMVSGYAQQGHPREALELLNKMKGQGEKPSLVTWNALIAGFAQVGDCEIALELFRAMRVDAIKPDVISWTSVVSGFVQHFRNREAFDTFDRMLSAGIKPSTYTISSLLPACATVANSSMGREIHGYALVRGVEEDVYVCSSLVDMYAKCGFIFEAEKLFNKMREKNTVTWNSMIFGYANHGQCTKAIEQFYKMLEEVEPDHVTFVAALTACSHAGMLKLGRDIFQLIREHRIEPRLEHYACMVDLLGRAGELTEAYNLIKTMSLKPDRFVWGALLGACKSHGNIELAKIAAGQLYEIEPESAGSCLSLSSLYANAGNWQNAERLKKTAKRKRLKISTGCSWLEIVQSD
ncbi:hypothetical protein Scep_005410 [Stephania cephalantha]|uniref:Pentatricopeptide repeat-containing protein n=1 Tax=Stephania cephalantha TaxID=152367 RepID=A0AAP0KUI3_9MAGN